MAARINTYFAAEVLRKYLGDLLDILNAISDPVTIASKLYSQKVITEKAWQKVLDTGQPEYERNQTILEAVRKSVKLKQEQILKFIGVLDEQSLPVVAQDVVAKMRSELSELTACIHSLVQNVR